MTNQEINSLEDVLALANMVNPGGQRILEDGNVQLALPYRGNNCTMVAIAAAAFLQDGTTVGSFSAPSIVLTGGLRLIISQITSARSLPTYSRPVITIATESECVRNAKQEPIDPSDVKDAVSQIHEDFPGQHLVINAHLEMGDYHWFNVTKDGVVIDAQSGLMGDHLLLGQQVEGEFMPFSEIEVYPVDAAITGLELVRELEGLHQTCAMNLLMSNLRSKLDSDNTLDMDTIIDTTEESLQDTNKPQNLGRYSLLATHTPHWLNDYCEELARLLASTSEDGRLQVIETLAAALQPTKYFVDPITADQQVWLTEATYREPGSTERTATVAQSFSDRSPFLREALDLNLVAQKMAAPETGTTIGR